MLVNKELAQSLRFNIQLKEVGRILLRISPYSGREEPFGREMDWLVPGAGVLLRAEQPVRPFNRRLVPHSYAES